VNAVDTASSISITAFARTVRDRDRAPAARWVDAASARATPRVDRRRVATPRVTRRRARVTRVGVRSIVRGRRRRRLGARRARHYAHSLAVANRSSVIGAARAFAVRRRDAERRARSG